MPIMIICRIVSGIAETMLHQCKRMHYTTKVVFLGYYFLIIRTVVHSANTQYNLLYVLSKIFFHFFFNFLAERNQFYTKGPWTFRLFLSTGFCKDKCYRSYFVVVTFLTEIQNQLEIHHLFKIWMVIFTTVQEF